MLAPSNLALTVATVRLTLSSTALEILQPMYLTFLRFSIMLS